MKKELTALAGLTADTMPPELRPSTYFDFSAHPFAHSELLESSASVVAAILRIRAYAEVWLRENLARARTERVVEFFADAMPSRAPCVGRFHVILEEGAVFYPSIVMGVCGASEPHTIFVERGARLIQAEVYLTEGSVWIGAGTTVEPHAAIKGPTIIGRNCEIRAGAYLRGCILGDRGVFRGEIKNAVVMDDGSFPHPSYLGDSICGYRTHFGNQVTAANFGLFEGLHDPAYLENIVLCVGGRSYDSGTPKLGIVLGDFCQVGCNSVSDPGTFLEPYTVVYPLSRIPRGFYGPRQILKNKPLEKGIIEVVPFDPGRSS